MISLRKLSVFFIIIVFLSLIAAKAESSYFAFSLREAVNHAREGNFSDELRHLAGITRFAGLVYDHNRQDIILVGLADSNLPKARFEDFCVALRARLIYDEFPLVSIDPVKDTEKTNLQKIRFDGHLENSYFGKKCHQNTTAVSRCRPSAGKEGNHAQSCRALPADGNPP